MPYRKNYKRKTTRRKGKKYPRRRRKKYPRYMPIGGFGNSKVVKFRYIKEIELNASVALYDKQHFSANGLYDPDLTSTLGHQPSGFDQWMRAYHSYRVIGAKIHVQCTPTGTGNITPGYLGIYLAHTKNELSDIIGDATGGMVSAIMEQPRNNTLRYAAGSNNSTGRYTRLIKTYSPKKFHGVQDLKDCEDLLGTHQTNPTDQAIFTVYQLTVGTNDPGKMHCLVKIDYITLLTDRLYTEPS